MGKKRILIVDDEPSITTVFKVIIEKTGNYEVHTEAAGSRALAAAKAFKPDLILLDIMMPDVDGGEVASQLKEDDLTKEIPIVFISAAITKEEANAQGGVQGGYTILAKPVHVTQLMKCVEKYTAGSPVTQKNLPSDKGHARQDTKEKPERRKETNPDLPYKQI